MNHPNEKVILEKLKSLPPEHVAEVEDFVDFLRARNEGRAAARSERFWGPASWAWLRGVLTKGMKPEKVAPAKRAAKKKSAKKKVVKKK